ncbi:B- and T-lymphocyte attenuator isoform X2 [Anguilla anguilla]|uniref:B- and T-lymphocyte attenuator isoform X2 n=1 Tax=Anguilla anguilla TaxID=7936 RepID=UPI0015A80549|nr:B- and T-lymphocyte attenuator isoform X2 [Anguilla anguilla]
MRPQMERTSLALSLLLLVIYVPGDAWGQETHCAPEIQVKRSTTYKAVAKESLKIMCAVKHCGQEFNFTWCRFHTDNNCKPVDKMYSITHGWEKSKEDPNWGDMFLLFGNISLDDAGQYRCSIFSVVGSAVGHFITVSFSATESLHGGNGSNSNTHMSAEKELNTQGPSWIPHFSICTIVVAVVITVMVISFLCMNGCKGLQRSRNADASNCQYKVTMDKHGISTANQTAVDRNNSHPHDNDRDRCETSIIYVTLNHQSRQEDSARTSIVLEELTEYATIRFS